jgi:POT family proton-dependent oligopeptide transporter
MHGAEGNGTSDLEEKIEQEISITGTHEGVTETRS